ncbi:cytochrome C, partial [Burkholderia sp. Ac-20392]|nr:cytochrome C [Burkholderia sp. Ac-20392]
MKHSILRVLLATLLIGSVAAARADQA